MPSLSDKVVPRCLLCSMNCPIGARDDGLGHVGTVFPADVGIEQGACVRGLTAARLLGAPERLFTARKGGQEAPVEVVLQDMVEEASRFEPSQAAVVVDVNRPLEGVLAAASLCRQAGAVFAGYAPPADGVFLRAGLTSGPPFAQIADCDLVLSIGDPFSSHPAVAAFVRDMQFGARGNRLVALDAGWGRTCRGADQAVVVHPLKLAGFVAALAVQCGARAVSEALGGKSAEQICGALGVPFEQVDALARGLREAESPGIILSHSLGRYAAGAAVAAVVKDLGAALEARVWPLLAAANSAALPHLKAFSGGGDLTDVIREAEAGRLKVLLAAGFDPASVLPERLWTRLRESCEVLCWAGSLDTPFAGQADYVVPLALPWEEEGTVLDSGGRPAAFVPWLPKPDTVVTAAELLGRLTDQAGFARQRLPGVDELMGARTETVGVKELVGPDLLSPSEPQEGQAVVIGSPEPQGYTGGISLCESSWQVRIAAEEMARVSAELASELGLAEVGMVELRNGLQATVRCEAEPARRTADKPDGARVVAVPDHWRALREMLQWRGAEGTIEPAPALVNVKKCE